MGFLSSISRALCAFCPGLTPPPVPGKLRDVLAPLALCFPPLHPVRSALAPVQAPAVSPWLPPSSQTASSRQTDGITPGLPRELRTGDVCTCLLSCRGLWTGSCGEPRAEWAPPSRCPFQGRRRRDSPRKWRRTSQADVLEQDWWHNKEAKKRKLVSVDSGKAAWRQRPSR